MAGLAALSAPYSSSVRLPAAPLTGQCKIHTYNLSYPKKPQNKHTCISSATHAPLSRNLPRKAIIANCQVSGWSVKSAPPLLGSIKATARWRTSDSVFCVRGAKRNLIHTSLTRCALKRLLSLQHTRLQRETGAQHAFRPNSLHFLSGWVPERLRGTKDRTGYLLFKGLVFLRKYLVFSKTETVLNWHCTWTEILPWILISLFVWYKMNAVWR